jgi:dephospho-CoA kinase
MKKIFVIGGMGAGKSTASRAICDLGAEYIDLDKVGHEVLTWDNVKTDLVEDFGDDILNDEGEIDRSKLAAKAFLSPAATRKLNRATMPRIEEAYADRLDLLEEQGVDAVVVEYSVFKSRMESLAYSADVVIAVLAPMEQRLARAVASGFDEEDARRRIARQITDADRVEAADVVFSNTSTREDLYEQVAKWWKAFNAAE